MRSDSAESNSSHLLCTADDGNLSWYSKRWLRAAVGESSDDSAPWTKASSFERRRRATVSQVPTSPGVLSGRLWAAWAAAQVVISRDDSREQHIAPFLLSMRRRLALLNALYSIFVLPFFSFVAQTCP